MYIRAEMNGYYANVCERYINYTKNTKNANLLLSAFSAKGCEKQLILYTTLTVWKVSEIH